MLPHLHERGGEYSKYKKKKNRGFYILQYNILCVKHTIGDLPMSVLRTRVLRKTSFLRITKNEQC